MRIRQAQLSDLDAITEIYNEAIQMTTASFDTEPKTREEQLQWFAEHGARHPILVAELDGSVVGWSCLSPWSSRCAYNATAESTFYVKDGYRGRGIGRRLKGAVIDEARRLGFHVLIEQIAEGSHASRHLSEAFGFEHVGTLKEVGRKFGKVLDVYLYELILNRPPGSKSGP